MQVIAQQKYIRTSPQKLRLVVNSVKHLSPSEALVQLRFMNKRAAETLAKVINQAMNNAVNNQRLSEEDLVIESIEINEGPTYKRWQAVSRGRANSIFKRTSHIKVALKTKTVTTKPVVAVNKDDEGKVDERKTRVNKTATKKVKRLSNKKVEKTK